MTNKQSITYSYQTPVEFDLPAPMSVPPYSLGTVLSNAARKDELHSSASGTKTGRVSPMSEPAPSAEECFRVLQKVGAVLSAFWKWPSSGRALALCSH